MSVSVWLWLWLWVYRKTGRGLPPPGPAELKGKEAALEKASVIKFWKAEISRAGGSRALQRTRRIQSPLFSVPG